VQLDAFLKIGTGNAVEFTLKDGTACLSLSLFSISLFLMWFLQKHTFRGFLKRNEFVVDVLRQAEKFKHAIVVYDHGQVVQVELRLTSQK
jgi:hypothetical protein